MKKHTKQYFKMTLTGLILFSTCLVFATINPVKPFNLDKAIEKAKKLKFEQPDSAIQQLKLIHEVATENKDTSIAIRSLMELASVYGHQANYKASYNQLWSALLLADASQNQLRKSFIYKAIGRYYSFFNRKEKAVTYLQLALNLKKEYVNENNFSKAHLTDNYHGFVATYRELDEPQLAQQYLDSAFFYYHPNISNTNLALLKFERGVLYNVNKQPKKALTLFEEVLPWFQENNATYQVLVYNYIGDSYQLLADYKNSEKYYLSALAISEEHKSHIDFTPLIYERLYEVNYKQGKYKQAALHLKQAKNLDALFFDSRSENNRPLLEIQDAFRQTKIEQANYLKEQQLIQLEQEKKVSFLEKTLLIGCIGCLMLLSFLYFRYVRAKYKAEKQLIRKEQELEIQKTNELVELKNKELAAFALKLIEKENFIEALREKLSKGNGEVKRQELENLVYSAVSSSKESWSEFEARFVSVNTSFYQNLKAQFPKLTQGDLKLCALVKLNFSSKEMARLTGISIDSMHTTRSRLRKKLNLAKGSNLKEFIANI